MKKSKFRRVMTFFLVILGVLAVLFGCLSPLLFQRDERLSASAAVSTYTSFFVQGQDITLSDYISGVTITYTDENGERHTVHMTEQNSNSYVLPPITIENSDMVIFGFGLKPGVSLSSVTAHKGSPTGSGSGLIATINGTAVNLSTSVSSGTSIFIMIGVSVDYSEAYDQIYNEGYESGYDQGYQEGHDAGLNDNSQYQAGYNSGYQAGYTDGTGVSYSNLNVVSLFLSPVNSFLSTPLFGSFSFGTAFSVVLVVLLGAIFIKMFAGG